MWLFTQYGFFSVVSAREGDGAPGLPVDPQRVQVRAREGKHLDALRTRFADQLGASPILETKSSDYRFRLIVRRDAWARVMAALVEELDYDNFKGRCAERHAAGGAEYVHALHRVWNVMHATQRSESGARL